MNRKSLSFAAILAATSLCLTGGAALAQSRPASPEVIAAFETQKSESARIVGSAATPRTTNLKLPPKPVARVASRKVTEQKKLAAAPAPSVNVATAQEPATTATIPAKPKSPLFWMTVGSGF